MQSRAAAMEDVIKATEHLLHENEGKLGTEELAKVETKLLEVKAQHKVLSQSAEKLQKQVDSALTKAVQQETEKVTPTRKSIEVLKVSTVPPHYNGRL